MNEFSQAAKPSPFGLWNETAAPRPGVAELQDDFTAETAIIGGGFCGLSAALHLAEGGTQPLLVEAEEPGFGASGRNGGQVIAGLKLDPGEMIARFGRERGEALHRFSAGTADLVFSLIERFQIQCEAHRDGWIQAAYAPKVLAAIRRRADELMARGENVELLDEIRMAKLTGTDFYRGGMLDRRSGMVQPFSYARGLARAATASGAMLFGNSRVTRLVREKGHWRLETAKGSVTAKEVLLATNAYLGDLHPGLRTAMIPVASYQLATDPLPADLDQSILPSRLPVSDLMQLGVYFRRDDEGRFIIGGRGSFTERERPDLFDRIRQHARKLFPALGAIDFPIRWGGKLALTFDHLPRLVTLEPGLHAAYGCNGRGVALQTLMGKLAAERMRGVRHDDLPIATLPPARYPFYSLRLPAMILISNLRSLRRIFARD
ncbi:MAG: FAD-binding oxidoreductase [Hyphomicrobiales bacterium]|nr:FAD-binding oxidoreductase [Hyphomicrobiales bacterium]